VRWVILRTTHRREIHPLEMAGFFIGGEMAKLSYKQRKRLPDSAFAVDGKKRKYPITDKSHARNALARVSAFGTPQEKKAVRSAVYRKFPSLKKNSKK